MDATERSRFHRALLGLKEQILQEGDVPIEPNRTDPTVIGGDEDAQPLNEMNQAIASKRNKNRAGLLTRIEAALACIEQDPDDFGLCRECDEPISGRRLELMPYVELCTECQQKQDGQTRATSRRHLTDYH